MNNLPESKKLLRISLVIFVALLLLGSVTLLLMSFSQIAKAQGGSTGRDGELIVTDTVYIDTERYAITETIETGSITIPFSANLNLVAGDEILIIDMQGSNAGTYETAFIQVVGSDLLTLTTGLSYSYTDKIMVQRIPNYTGVTVKNGGNLKAHTWDGETGGIAFLRAVTMTIEAGGQISTDGQGYGTNMTLGYGPGGGNRSGGGGYGGLGGGSDQTYGLAYGSVKEPTGLGSGGGSFSYNFNNYWGGNGGGAIRLVVSETLHLDGVLSANGADASSGGGAGGSLWITTDILTGTGQIQANGGQSTYGGGGGGGRIALYYGGSLTDTLTIEALGGSGQQPGQQGSVYLNSFDVDPASSTVEVEPTVITADGITSGTIVITLKDENGHRMPGEGVAVSLASGAQAYINGEWIVSPTVFVDLGVTNVEGVSTGTITATVAGERLVLAKTGSKTIQDQAVVEFTAGPVDGAKSLISFLNADNQAIADGMDTVVVMVIARDAFSNTVPGLSTSLSTSPAVTVSPDIPPDTDENGEATFFLSHDQPAQVVISATVDGQIVGQTVTATFEGPDLEVSKQVHGQAYAGLPATYTLTVQNTGPVTATGVVLTDTLPVELAFASEASAGLTFSRTDPVLSWQAENDLGPGQTLTVSLVVTPNSSLADGTLVTNVATAKTESTELDLVDNAYSLTHSVKEPKPQLALSPASPNLSVAPGQSGSLTMTLGNSGQLALISPVMTAPTVMPWVTVAPATLPASLQPGQQTVITVTAAPGETQAGTYRDFITAGDPSGGEQRVILTVNKLPISRTVLFSVENNQEQPVANAYIGLVQRDALIDVTPAFTNYVDVAFEGRTESTGQLALAGLPVGTYEFTIQAANHEPHSGSLTVSTGSGSQAESITLQARPALVVTPLQPVLVITPGGSGVQGITIANQGAAPLTGITVETALHPWLYLGLPSPLPETLPPGGQLNLSLYASPPITPNVYSGGVITISVTGQPAAILQPLVQVNEQDRRDVEILITDHGDLPLPGAVVSFVRQQETIQVTGGVTTTFNEQFSGRTASSGLASFADIPVGDYTYLATKPGYKPRSGTIEVNLADDGASAQAGGDGITVSTTSLPTTPNFQITISRPEGDYAAIPASFSPVSSGNYAISPASFNTRPLPAPDLQPANLPAFQSGDAQQFTLQLDEAPFSYQWQVTPIDQQYQIVLTISQVTSDSISMLIPNRAWTFVTCGSDTLTDSVLIHNPTRSAITLTGVTVSVPGVDTTILDHPTQLPAGGSTTIRVRGVRPANSAVGYGSLSLAGLYRAADTSPIVYTLNPSSYDNLFPAGQPIQQEYVLEPARFNPAATYSLSLAQPLFDWLSLSTDVTGSFPITPGTKISLALQVTPPDWLALNETYRDRAVLTLAGGGEERVGYLELEVTKKDTGIQVHTRFKLEAGPQVDVPLESSGVIEARVVTCAGGSSGTPATGGGPAGGYDWTPQPDGSLVGTRTVGGGPASGGNSGGVTSAAGAPIQLTGEASQEVRLELGQRLVLNGESFRAGLLLSNRFPDESIDDISVDLLVTDAGGADASGRFTVEPAPPSDLGTMAGGGQKAAEWIIRPSGTVTASEIFTLRAKIDYTFGGQGRTFTTMPESFTVEPAPELVITYELPEAGLVCTTFDLKATIHNQGAGFARGLRLSSGQPTIVGASGGTPLGFQIVKVAVDGQELPALALDLTLGDIGPNQSREVIWQMRASQPGSFTGFTSDFRMLNPESTLLAPRLRAIHTTFATPDDPFLYGCQTGTLSVSGQVRDYDGDPLASVTFIVASDATSATLTGTQVITPALGPNGVYTLTLPAGSNHTIVPIGLFTPTYRTFAPLLLPETGADFQEEAPPSDPIPGDHAFKGAGWLRFVNEGDLEGTGTDYENRNIGWNVETSEDIRGIGTIAPQIASFATAGVDTIVRIDTPDSFGPIRLRNLSPEEYAANQNRLNQLVANQDCEAPEMLAWREIIDDEYEYISREDIAPSVRFFILANEPNHMTDEWNYNAQQYAFVYNCYYQHWRDTYFEPGVERRPPHSLLVAGPGHEPGRPNQWDVFLPALFSNLDDADGFTMHVYGYSIQECRDPSRRPLLETNCGGDQDGNILFKPWLNSIMTQMNTPTWNNKPLIITEYNPGAGVETIIDPVTGVPTNERVPFVNRPPHGWEDWFDRTYCWGLSAQTVYPNVQLRGLIYYVDEQDNWRNTQPRNSNNDLMDWWPVSLRSDGRSGSDVIDDTRRQLWLALDDTFVGFSVVPTEANYFC